MANPIISLTGNTIEFSVAFTDFDNATLIDPDLLYFIWYDSSFTMINTVTVDTVASKVSLGNYKIYFTPTLEGNYIYEIKCIKNDLQSLYRDRVKVVNIISTPAH